MIRVNDILMLACVGIWLVSNIALGGAPTDSLTLDFSTDSNRHVMLAVGTETDPDSGQERQAEVSMRIRQEEKDETQKGETLYNGILLPEQWPPDYGGWTREPMPVPYLENPPEVINIDVGRQLFVDDFLIEETTLQRTFHQPIYYEGNPIIEPDREWEHHGPAPFRRSLQRRRLVRPEGRTVQDVVRRRLHQVQLLRNVQGWGSLGEDRAGRATGNEHRD